MVFLVVRLLIGSMTFDVVMKRKSIGHFRFALKIMSERASTLMAYRSGFLFLYWRMLMFVNGFPDVLALAIAVCKFLPAAWLWRRPELVQNKKK